VRGAFGGPQESAGLFDGEGAGGGLGEIVAPDAGRPEADPAVEGVQGGQGEVDRGGLGLALGDEVGAVVPDGVVPGVAVGERLALAAAGDRVEFGEPGQVAADPAGVGAM